MTLGKTVSLAENWLLYPQGWGGVIKMPAFLAYVVVLELERDNVAGSGFQQ